MNVALLVVICLLVVWILWREFSRQEREDELELAEVDDPAGREILTPEQEASKPHVAIVTDAPEMALEDAIEKAKSIITAHHYDQKLLHLYLKVKHYGFFARHSDVEQRWNIGVQNISAETKETEIGYYKVKMDFVTFFLDKDMITLGFASHRVSHPDHYKVFEVIQYGLNNKLVMTLEYENEVAETHHVHADHSHFRFTNVEEFHNNDYALSVLDRLEEMIDRHNQRQIEHHHERHDENYRGKFSFKH
jgi:hypothetical protein